MEARESRARSTYRGHRDDCSRGAYSYRLTDMLIITTVISILAISVFVSLVNRILSFAVCPICAGVFLTWVGLVSAHFMGYSIDLVVPGLLMGGSVVGIAFQ